MNGILLFNKPKGITSHDAVSLLRKKTGIKKIGHTGTLDPIATGILPLCIGRATKVADYILKSKKEYYAELLLGVETDTYDVTGKEMFRSDKIVSETNFLEALQSFKGKIQQFPPMYSAIKIKGKKLYEYAREGIFVERKSREITIFSINLLEYQYPIAKIQVSCSAGTYIRSLIHDLGEILGCYATLQELCRIQTSDFNLKDAISKEELDRMSLKKLEQRLIPMEMALNHLPRFDFPDSFYEKALNGNFFLLSEKMDQGPYRLYCRNEFLGIGEIRMKDGKQFMKISKKLAG